MSGLGARRGRTLAHTNLGDIGTLVRNETESADAFHLLRNPNPSSTIEYDRIPDDRGAAGAGRGSAHIRPVAIYSLRMDAIAFQYSIERPSGVCSIARSSNWVRQNGQCHSTSPVSSNSFNNFKEHPSHNFLSSPGQWTVIVYCTVLYCTQTTLPTVLYSTVLY